MKNIAFPNWVVMIVTLLVLLNLGGFVAGLFGAWILDSYWTPAFSEQSFPQPRLY